MKYNSVDELAFFVHIAGQYGDNCAVTSFVNIRKPPAGATGGSRSYQSNEDNIPKMNRENKDTIKGLVYGFLSESLPANDIVLCRTPWSRKYKGNKYEWHDKKTGDCVAWLNKPGTTEWDLQFFKAEDELSYNPKAVIGFIGYVKNMGYKTFDLSVRALPNPPA